MKNTTGFTPFFDNILIKLPEVEETTEAGIIKDEATIAAELAAQQDASDGSVLVSAVGELVEKTNVGDTILIRNTRLPILEIHNKRYAVIREMDVIGRVEECDVCLDEEATCETH